MLGQHRQAAAEGRCGRAYGAKLSHEFACAANGGFEGSHRSIANFDRMSGMGRLRTLTILGPRRCAARQTDLRCERKLAGEYVSQNSLSDVNCGNCQHQIS